LLAIKNESANIRELALPPILNLPEAIPRNYGENCKGWLRLQHLYNMQHSYPIRFDNPLIPQSRGEEGKRGGVGLQLSVRMGMGRDSGLTQLTQRDGLSSKNVLLNSHNCAQSKYLD